ncbi:MAG: CBS domain-containing protein [Actinomycetota bacterium]|jgi:CBS domain-containing protein|nr:CBS domain-containing protein [Actinomycetota bacterium]
MTVRRVASLPVKVRDIMTSTVISTTQGTPVGDVANLLHGHHVSAVPVLDEAGSLVGLVSEYDLLAKEGETAGEIMTTALISVSEDSDVDDVRHLLVERRIRRVPVLAAGRLVGIVSRGDVVATLATEWVCTVCGESVRRLDPPEQCPRCHADGSRFVFQEQVPGS